MTPCIDILQIASTRNRNIWRQVRLTQELLEIIAPWVRDPHLGEIRSTSTNRILLENGSYPSLPLQAISVIERTMSRIQLYTK
jgi:hypothetical protein